MQGDQRERGETEVGGEEREQMVDHEIDEGTLVAERIIEQGSRMLDRHGEAVDIEDEKINTLCAKLCGGLAFTQSVMREAGPCKSHFYWVAKCGTILSERATRHYAELVLRMMEVSNKRDIYHEEYEMERQHEAELASDSSDMWVGAVGYDKDGNMFYIQEKWSDIDEGMGRLHINDKELLAHIICVEVIREKVCGDHKVVRTAIDNTTAETWIRKLYSKMDKMSGREAQEKRLEWITDYACYQHARGVEIRPYYIRSEENILPDALSRPDTHQHIFDSHVAQMRAAGKSCTRLRVGKGWGPSKN
jgi:hypothetical protein